MIGSLINFQNVFTEAIITFIVILIIFFALGRLIQNKTKLFQNSYLISPFIGFLVYLAITAIAFIPFLFFGTTGDVLWWVELIKNLSIIIVVVVFSAAWLPQVDYKRFDIKKSLKLFSVLAVLATLIVSQQLMGNFIPSFSSTNESAQYIAEIERLSSFSNSSFVFDPFLGNSHASLHTNNNIFYHWTIVFTLKNSMSTMEMFNFILAPLSVIFVYSLMNELVHVVRKKTNIIFTTILTFMFVVFLSSQHPVDPLYWVAILSFATMLGILKDNSLKRTNLSYLVFSLSSALMLYAFAPQGLLMLLILGGLVVVHSIQKQRSPVFVTFIYTFFIMIVLLLFVNEIHFWLMPLVSMASLIFMIPLWNLTFSRKRKQDLVRFEAKLTSKLNAILWTLLISSAVVTVVVGLLNTSTVPNVFVEFFTNAFPWMQHSTANATINITIVSSILITFFAIGVYSVLNKKNDESYIYALMGWLTLLVFNPIQMIWISPMLQTTNALPSIFLIYGLPIVLLSVTTVFDIYDKAVLVFKDKNPLKTRRYN